jgi:hypothetical protein
MMLNTTCNCNACKNIGNLDLKFFVHYGEFMLQPLHTYTEMIGSDVNLIHRLTKNHVTEKTGQKAYILYSQAAIDKLDLQDWVSGLPCFVETYDHVGDVQIYVQNVHELWDAQREAMTLGLKPEEVIKEMSYDLPLDLVHAWDYVTKPEFKALFTASDSANVKDLKKGRVDVGSVYLCAHGENISPQTIVDWQPFGQYSFESRVPGGGTVTTTVRLNSIEGGTNIIVSGGRVKGLKGIYKLLFPILGIWSFKFFQDKGVEKLRKKIVQDIESGFITQPEAIDISAEDIGKAIRESLKKENAA